MTKLSQTKNSSISLVLRQLALLLLVLLVFNPSHAFAHCQIPCGIFDDAARISGLIEDTSTIEKASLKIRELSKKQDPLSQNQLVRWVMTKESHAEGIIKTVSEYFLAQRVKKDQKNYPTALVDHHAVIVAAMKAKQSTEQNSVKVLLNAIKKLEAYYPGHKH